MTEILTYFSLNYTIYSFVGYPLSFLELLGTSSGLVCVYLASRNHILTWPIGIFNSICFFYLFYQVQLYSDMLLQIFFFGSSIYGWFIWKQRKGKFKKIHSLGLNKNLILFVFIFIFTFLLGEFSKSLPILLPNFFTLPPSYPYYDAFTTVASVVANFLLARRVLESWFLWVFVDIVCIVLYFLKDIPFITAEYTVFLAIAFYGCWYWYKEFQQLHITDSIDTKH